MKTEFVKEILEYIFCFSSLDDLFSSFPLVCKQWYQITKNDQFWKRIANILFPTVSSLNVPKTFNYKSLIILLKCPTRNQFKKYQEYVFDKTVDQLEKKIQKIKQEVTRESKVSLFSKLQEYISFQSQQLNTMLEINTVREELNSRLVNIQEFLEFLDSKLYSAQIPEATINNLKIILPFLQITQLTASSSKKNRIDIKTLKAKFIIIGMNGYHCIFDFFQEVEYHPAGWAIDDKDIVLSTELSFKLSNSLTCEQQPLEDRFSIFSCNKQFMKDEQCLIEKNGFLDSLPIQSANKNKLLLASIIEKLKFKKLIGLSHLWLLVYFVLSSVKIGDQKIQYHVRGAIRNIYKQMKAFDENDQKEEEVEEEDLFLHDNESEDLEDDSSSGEYNNQTPDADQLFFEENDSDNDSFIDDNPTDVTSPHFNSSDSEEHENFQDDDILSDSESLDGSNELQTNIIPIDEEESSSDSSINEIESDDQKSRKRKWEDQKDDSDNEDENDTKKKKHGD